MPTRVTIPEARHAEVMTKLSAEIARHKRGGVTSSMAAQETIARRRRRPHTRRSPKRVLSAAGGLRAGLAAEGPLPSRRDVRTVGDELLEVLFPESHRMGSDGGDLRDHVAATIATLEAHLEAAIFLCQHRLHRAGTRRQVPDAGARDHAAAAGGAARRARAAGQGRPGGVRVRSGGQRHRRDRRLLPGPVRDRDLPRRQPAARLRRRGAAAHADRVRALAHRHRHPPGRDDRRRRSSSTTAPASSSARPAASATACASTRG